MSGSEQESGVRLHSTISKRKEPLVPGATRAVLGEGLRVGIEAGIEQGWGDILAGGPFIGMRGFGASAPINDLYKHFGITSEAIRDKVVARLSS